MLYHLFSSCVPCCRTIFMKLYQIVKWILPVRIWNFWLGITHAKILAMPLPILLRSVYVHPTIFTRRDKYVSLLVCDVKQRKRVTWDLGHTRSEKQGVSFSFIILLRLEKVVNCFGHMTWCRMKKKSKRPGWSKCDSSPLPLLLPYMAWSVELERQGNQLMMMRLDDLQC